MKYIIQRNNWSLNSKVFSRVMGLFTIPSIIALILTVAGLLTTQNWSLNRSALISRYSGDHSDTSPSSSSTSSLSSLPPYLWQLKPTYNKHNRRNSKSEPMARYDGFLDGFGGGAVEKNDFYYILPILLVIGLGSFLIPIISTFFTAMVTSSSAIGGCCGRRKRRGSLIDMKPIFGIGSIYEVWDSVEKAIEKFANDFDNN